MKIALVCDWLTTTGGAEKVLLELHQMFPEAPIYTSQYNPKKINWFQDAEVHTGWLQIFPACLRKILGPLRQIYFHFLDLSDYDLVISVTGAEAKSVKTKKGPSKSVLSSHYSTDSAKSQEFSASNPKKSSPGAYHLCYCHVPTQYYWQFYDKYVENPGFGFFNSLVRFCFKLLVRPLRKADLKAAREVDQFVTISNYAASEIKKYYHREATVIAPPVEIEKFKLPQKSDSSKRQGFIISCRQVTWKRVDLAIQACIACQVDLAVIGDGSEHHNLVKLANNSPYIHFYTWLDSEKLAQHLQKASGYIFPSMEPFGIAAVEALAAGCPVIAYRGGGSQDFVKSGENGIFFDQQTEKSIAKALKDFQKYHFNSKTVAKSAEKFSKSRFRKAINQQISLVFSQKHNVKNKQKEVKK